MNLEKENEEKLIQKVQEWLRWKERREMWARGVSGNSSYGTGGSVRTA